MLAIAASTPVFTDVGGLRLPWPASSPTVAEDPRVPVAFAGAGIARGSVVPDGTGLDAIAPTVASALGFDRPFPEVRSGAEIPGVAERSTERPRLVLLISWRGIGSDELERTPDAWPYLASMLAEGAGTLEAQTGSLPLDPAAVLTTIGTGGLPAQHGITGSSIRDDMGSVRSAFADDAPVPVIASLADDLEEADPATLVGLVVVDARDRGLVGGGWYAQQDPVDVVIGDTAAAPLAVEVHLSTGYGADDVRRLRFIRSAQAAGFTLEQIGELLALDATTDRARVRQLAHERVVALDAQIEELRRVRSSLHRLAQECRAGSDGPCPILEAFDARDAGVAP